MASKKRGCWNVFVADPQTGKAIMKPDLTMIKAPELKRPKKTPAKTSEKPTRKQKETNKRSSLDQFPDFPHPSREEDQEPVLDRRSIERGLSRWDAQERALQPSLSAEKMADFRKRSMEEKLAAYDRAMANVD